MSFRVTGLDPAPFQSFFGASDADLARQGIVRMPVEAKPGAPCRISLADAEVGETVLLLNFTHQDADTPYHQQGPIFVRETKCARFDAVDALPPTFPGRMLSLRGFDKAGMMVDADLTQGAEAATLIARFFDNPEIAYIHAHYAKRGCFAALIERA